MPQPPKQLELQKWHYTQTVKRYLCFFQDSVSLCNSSGCSGTCGPVDHAGLKLTVPPASASQETKGLKACAATTTEPDDILTDQRLRKWLSSEKYWLLLQSL